MFLKVTKVSPNGISEIMLFLIAMTGKKYNLILYEYSVINQDVILMKTIIMMDDIS